MSEKYVAVVLEQHWLSRRSDSRAPRVPNVMLGTRCRHARSKFLGASDADIGSFFTGFTSAVSGLAV